MDAVINMMKPFNNNSMKRDKIKEGPSLEYFLHNSNENGKKMVDGALSATKVPYLNKNVDGAHQKGISGSYGVF